MLKLSEITVAILAGGRGTRLAAKSSGQQKVMMKVRLHPFLKYILNQLNEASFQSVVLCTGYRSDQVEKELGENYKNIQILHSPESLPLGTAGSLRNAFNLFKSEVILVMNGDSYCDVDLKKFWQFHLKKRAKISLVLAKDSDTSRFGKVTLASDKSIVRFEEKKVAKQAGLINTGIYLIDKAVIKKIPEGRKISLEEEMFPQWIGKDFYGYEEGHDFIDIGTPESYAKAEQFFLRYPL